MSTATADSGALQRRLTAQLAEFRRDGVYKQTLYLESPQAARVRMEGRGEVIILSSNNYLGLCDHPAVMAAGKAGIDRFGAGTASVRFICGTFTIHRELEASLAALVGTEASTSFVSCWNANEALPATILTAQDIILSDQLNHASIIDAMRLAKAITRCETACSRTATTPNSTGSWPRPRGKDVKLVVSDGVFSMEGSIVNLPALLEVCRRHGALVWLDDSHATGVLGRRRARARPSISAWSARSTSSPRPWARRWAAPPADSPPDRRQSAITSCNAPVPSCSPTPSRPPSPPRPSRRSGSSGPSPSGWPGCGTMRHISGASWWNSGFDPFRAILLSYP